MWIRTTKMIPTTCRAGSLCCRAKSISHYSSWLAVGRALTEKLLLDKLLAADDADLGQAETLGRGHHASDHVVFRGLVRAQMHLRLNRLRGCGLESFLQRGPVGNRLSVPID